MGERKERMICFGREIDIAVGRSGARSLRCRDDGIGRGVCWRQSRLVDWNLQQ